HARHGVALRRRRRAGPRKLHPRDRARDGAGLCADGALARTPGRGKRLCRLRPSRGRRCGTRLRTAHAAQHALAARRDDHPRHRAGDRVGLGAQLSRARGLAAQPRMGIHAQRRPRLPAECTVDDAVPRPRDRRHGDGADDPRPPNVEGTRRMSSLLNVTSLSADLPGAGRVVDGVSLAVGPGEVLGIVGESGAGKSVLARSLLGLTQRDGSVTAEALEINGRDMRRAGQRAWRRARGSEIGLVLQDALQSLDPLRTTAAEVGETLQILRVPRRERRERVLEALRGAGLPDAQSLLAKRSGELSGGMRQRVLIASAIVGGARLIVADEPTTALDATVAARILALLRSLADDGAAVVFITRDLAAVRRVADRVAVMENGRIVEQGPATQILEAPT